MNQRSEGRTELSSIRQVKLYWVVGGGASTYLVLASEIDRFVEATKKLHWLPGINPHVKDRDNSCAKIWRITVAEMAFRGPFWWTVPDLKNNNDPRGARIIDVVSEKIVFNDDEYTARIRAEELEEQAAHFRAQEQAADLSKAGETA